MTARHHVMAVHLVTDFINDGSPHRVISELGLEAGACNPSVQMAEAEGLCIQG